MCCARTGVEAVLNDPKVSISKEEIAYGRTKVFVRTPKTVCYFFLFFLPGREGENTKASSIDYGRHFFTYPGNIQ